MDCPIIQNLDPISGFVSAFIEGKQYTVRATDANFSSAVETLKANNKDLLLEILNPALKIQKLYAKYEQVEVKDGNVFVNGEAISSVVADRIINCLLNGLDCLHIFKFITKLEMNPSKRAVDELYTFLEHQMLPITENGNFLAYKALRSNYTDCRTGKFDNSVDAILEMPRNKVDDNKEIGCSEGLHAGTLEYASKFRPQDGKLVVVEINPADVVSIPTDCNCQKLRTCKYKVVFEYEVPLDQLKYQSHFSTEIDEDVDREWEDTFTHKSDCGNCNCGDCACCSGSCDCKCDDDTWGNGCMGDPDEPKTEVQLELNLDNKMKEDDWKLRRFNYLKMMNFLYSNRRPAVANALRNFYRDVDYQEMINPEFSVILQFTSEDDAHKIYLDYKF